MTDLWTEASRDVEAETRERRFTAARVATAPVWTFLAAAEHPADFENRLAVVADRIDAVCASLADGAEFAVLRNEINAAYARDFSILNEDRLRQEAKRRVAERKKAEREGACASCGHPDSSHTGGPNADECTEKGCGCSYFRDPNAGKESRKTAADGPTEPVKPDPKTEEAKDRAVKDINEEHESETPDGGKHTGPKDECPLCTEGGQGDDVTTTGEVGQMSSQSGLYVPASLKKQAKDYDEATRKEYASKGWAMSDGSFPIADCGDVSDAKHRIGTSTKDKDSVIAHINKRAKELGCPEVGDTKEAASSYRGDPRWITTRYGSTCRNCKRRIEPGESAFYWPYDKKMHCADCGQAASRRFHSEVADEDFMNRRSFKRTAEEHGGYHLEQDGGRWKVVNHIGEVKSTFDSKDEALRYQRALMVNVPGAQESAESHEEHGDKPKHSSRSRRPFGSRTAADAPPFQKQDGSTDSSDDGTDSGDGDQGVRIGALQQIVATQQPTDVEGHLVDVDTAQNLIDIFGQLNPDNQARFDDVPLPKLIDWANSRSDQTQTPDQTPTASPAQQPTASLQIGQTTYSSSPYYMTWNGTYPTAGSVHPLVVNTTANTATMRKGAPFADYKDFDDCTSKNSDKDDPSAYCGRIKHETEDKKESTLQKQADEDGTEYGVWGDHCPHCGNDWKQPHEPDCLRLTDPARARALEDRAAEYWRKHDNWGGVSASKCAVCDEPVGWDGRSWRHTGSKWGHQVVLAAEDEGIPSGPKLDPAEVGEKFENAVDSLFPTPKYLSQRHEGANPYLPANNPYVPEAAKPDNMPAPAPQQQAPTGPAQTSKPRTIPDGSTQQPPPPPPPQAPGMGMGIQTMPPTPPQRPGGM